MVTLSLKQQHSKLYNQLMELFFASLETFIMKTCFTVGDDIAIALNAAPINKLQYKEPPQKQTLQSHLISNE